MSDTFDIFDLQEMQEERGANARYQMFSREGNDACEEMVARVVADVEAGLVTRKNLRARVGIGIETVAGLGHDEVYDTEPQYAIADQITARVCRPQMWQDFSRWGD